MTKEPVLQVELRFINGTRELVYVDDPDEIIPNKNDAVLTLHDIDGNTRNIPYCNLLQWVELWSDLEKKKDKI